VAAPLLSCSACVMVGGERGSQKNAVEGDDDDGDRRIGYWGATTLYHAFAASQGPHRPPPRTHAPHTGATAAARARPQLRMTNPPPPAPPARPSRESQGERFL